MSFYLGFKPSKGKQYEKSESFVRHSLDAKFKLPPSVAKQITKETAILSGFLEGTSKCLNVSFLFSKSPKAIPQLPKPPKLVNFPSLAANCALLHSSFSELKETLFSRVELLEESNKRLLTENKRLRSRFSAESSELRTTMSVDLIKEEVSQLREEIIMSCSGMQYILEEAERFGFKRSHSRIEGLTGYVTEVKALVVSLCRECMSSSIDNTETRRSNGSTESFQCAKSLRPEPYDEMNNCLLSMF